MMFFIIQIDLFLRRSTFLKFLWKVDRITKSQIFNQNDIQRWKNSNNRILHWLMRIFMFDLNETQRFAKHNVIFIKNAVYAILILNNKDANMIIKNDIDLTEHIITHNVDVFEFFSKSKFELWKNSVHDNKKW